MVYQHFISHPIHNFAVYCYYVSISVYEFFSLKLQYNNIFFGVRILYFSYICRSFLYGSNTELLPLYHQMPHFIRYSCCRILESLDGSFCTGFPFGGITVFLLAFNQLTTHSVFLRVYFMEVTHCYWYPILYKFAWWWYLYCSIAAGVNPHNVSVCTSLCLITYCLGLYRLFIAQGPSEKLRTLYGPQINA